MKIALIRHGPTEWNAQKRVQGSVDTPLSQAGIAKMSALLPPAGFDGATAYCSPKRRARQTAALLGLADPILDARLVEQNWGEWEGLTRAEMLARDGADAFDKAGRGLAFRPPGGESTAEVHARVKNFFAAIAQSGDVVAVSHAGVLRAAYALATGWDMLAPYPPDLDLSLALILALDQHGIPAIAECNAPLRRRENPYS